MSDHRLFSLRIIFQDHLKHVVAVSKQWEQAYAMCLSTGDSLGWKNAEKRLRVAKEDAEAAMKLAGQAITDHLLTLLNDCQDEKDSR